MLCWYIDVILMRYLTLIHDDAWPLILDNILYVHSSPARLFVMKPTCSPARCLWWYSRVTRRGTRWRNGNDATCMYTCNPVRCIVINGYEAHHMIDHMSSVRLMVMKPTCIPVRYIVMKRQYGHLLVRMGPARSIWWNNTRILTYVSDTMSMEIRNVNYLLYKLWTHQPLVDTF